MVFVNKLNELYSKLENILMYIAGFLLTTMMGLVGIEIISRRIFGSSISGIFEITTELMTAVTLLGIAYVQRNKEHIQIDIIYDKMPKQMMKISEIIIYFIVAVLLFVFATRGFNSFMVAFKSGEHTIGTLSVPLWPGKLTVALSFYIASFRFLIDSILQIDEIRVKQNLQ